MGFIRHIALYGRIKQYMTGVGERRFVSHSVTRSAHIILRKKVVVVGRKR